MLKGLRSLWLSLTRMVGGVGELQFAPQARLDPFGLGHASDFAQEAGALVADPMPIADTPDHRDRPAIRFLNDTKGLSIVARQFIGAGDGGNQDE